jgi:hypothetical protein
MAILHGVHERLVALLQALPDEAFARPLVHPVNGPHTVDTLVALYAWHGRHHVAHITGTWQREMQAYLDREAQPISTPGIPYPSRDELYDR